MLQFASFFGLTPEEIWQELDMMCRENFHGMCFWENISIQLRICMNLQYKTEKLQSCTKIVIYVGKKKHIYM